MAGSLRCGRAAGASVSFVRRGAGRWSTRRSSRTRRQRTQPAAARRRCRGICPKGRVSLRGRCGLRQVRPSRWRPDRAVPGHLAQPGAGDAPGPVRDVRDRRDSSRDLPVLGRSRPASDRLGRSEQDTQGRLPSERRALREERHRVRGDSQGEVDRVPDVKADRAARGAVGPTAGNRSSVVEPRYPGGKHGTFQLPFGLACERPAATAPPATEPRSTGEVGLGGY